AHDRLVGLDVDAGDVGQEPRAPVDLFRPHAGLDPEEVLPRPEGHHDLFEGGVPGPLADAVDGALHLASAVLDGHQGVRHRLHQVVVAVDGDDGLAVVPDVLADPGDPLPPLSGHGVPDRVRDVDGPGAGLDDRLQHVAHVLEVRARGVLGRELDVVAVGPG